MPDPSESPAPMPAGLAEPAFDANAMRVLKERYFAKKADGTVETPKEFLWRVASSIAKPERPYAVKLGKDADAVVDGVSHAFYDMMSRRDFMPNTPCLVNAGRPLSMLSACFVLPVPDSIEGIFYNIKAMALVQKAGGGTGMAFSELRHNGADVVSTGKDASGPVSFMKVFNAATDSIKQGGVRRGANMGVLRVNHPDIFQFINCKKDLDAENRALWNRLSDSGHYSDAQLALMKQELLQTQINNFNISIGVTDDFMDAVKADDNFDLIDPRTKEVVRTVKAREIWDAIVAGAWQNGEPGVLFLDHPDVNPLPGLGPISATNPCLTADTLVAVADGRGHVPIGELAAAGKDVPVFCYDDSGSITVRTMRRPRKTGTSLAVYRVTLDDGSVVRATENHKFRLRDGTYREVRSLRGGESLAILTKYQAPVVRAEHRLIAEHSHGSIVMRHFEEALEQGYDPKILGGFLTVMKTCEVCSNEFTLPYVNREIAYCSKACNVTSLNTDKDIQNRRQALQELQLDAYTALRAELGPDVLKRDWQAACAARNISAEISRESSPFCSYAELKDAASTFNHRVVSVEFDSIEDVYNGTVDDFHNFFVGGFLTTDKKGRDKLVYVNNKNCGEQFLHGYDSCNLGSINVGNFYDERAKDVDWERLSQTTALALRFLDNVIDANLYPIHEIEEMVTNNRRVGLGIMGFAELLIRLQIPYGSPEAIAFAGKLMANIQHRAEETSETLARERGDFPNKHLSIWANDPRPRRNAALLSIAPTGTISMIAGCAFGCEPYFGMAYTKHVMKDAEGRPQHLYYVVPLFEEIAKREGFFSDELLGKIEENRGSLKGIPEVPQHWQNVFTTSADVTVDQHIDMLAAFQKNTCNAVSKCVAAGTLIPTNKGLIPVERLGEASIGEFGELNDEYEVIGHDGAWHRVTGFYHNGRVPTVKVRLASGATIEASETHHLLTLGGWKSMAELKVDDLVVGRFEEISASGGAAIDNDFPVRFSNIRPTLPARMSENLALWLGMMAADGHTILATGNVGLSEKDESGEVGRRFDELCLELFGLVPHVATDKRTGVRVRYMTSRALTRYVESLIGKGARNKRVPDQVMRGSTAEKLAFLNGVTLDGYVTRGVLVIYAGISETLVDGLEAIARSIGVPSCYRATERRSSGYSVYQLRVSDELQSLLRPVETRKAVTRGPAPLQHLVRTPEAVHAMSVPYDHTEYSNLRSLKERRPEACKASTLDKLGMQLVDPKEYLVRVKMIERSEAETYDIEVADAHSYVVNGIVSHNTINAPNDDTRENVSRAIFRAYDAGCKGFTYYRDGSRTEQVVTFSKDNDLAGGNRDVAAAAPAPAVTTAAQSGTNDEPDIAALLAKANALLEV